MPVAGKTFGSHELSDDRDAVYHTLTPLTRVLMYVAPLFAIGALSWNILEARMTLEGVFVWFGPFLIVGALAAYAAYRVSHTIVVHKTKGDIEFRTFLGTRDVQVSRIVKISPAFLQHGQLVVKHADGSVVIPARFTGLHDLLDWIRRTNPAVVLKGV